MQSAPTPESCPVCGSDRIARILWGWVCLTREVTAEVEAGRVILGLSRQVIDRHKRRTAGDPQQTLHAPEWACLNCQPGWAKVHRMVMEEDERELAKLEAILASDFELAAAYRHLQDVAEDRIIKLVRRLQDGEPGASGRVSLARTVQRGKM